MGGVVIFLLPIFIAAALILILFIRGTLKAEVHNNYLCIWVTFLWFIIMHRCYRIRREKDALWTLYRVHNDEEIKIISLYDTIRRPTKKKIPKKQIRAVKDTLLYFLRRANFDININIVAGISNAATTAMVCGALRVLLSAANTVLKNKRRSFRIQITPMFSKHLFSFKAKGIMKLSLANIILGFILYKKIMRR
jgi:hypothetical protein